MGRNRTLLAFGSARANAVNAYDGTDIGLASHGARAAITDRVEARPVAGERPDGEISEEIANRQRSLILRYVVAARAR